MRFIKRVLAASLITAISSLNAAAAEPDVRDWPAIEKAASGQTVYFRLYPH